jgi:hypothetical protein
MTEDVENVKYRKFYIPRKRLFSHQLHPEGYITGVNSMGGYIIQRDFGG